jgi:hypothetical protein
MARPHILQRNFVEINSYLIKKPRGNKIVLLRRKKERKKDRLQEHAEFSKRPKQNSSPDPPYQCPYPARATNREAGGKPKRRDGGGK